MDCSNNCRFYLPLPPFICGGEDVTNGGISRIVFATCNTRFKNIEDPAEWCTYVKRGNIVVTSDIMGQMPKGNAIKKKVSSCKPERKIAMENTMTFMDYNIDHKSRQYRDWDFWKDISENESRYKVGFMTCDGRFYGFIDNFTIDVTQVIEDSSTGATFWDGTLGWQSSFSPKPIFIIDHLKYLNADCSDVPNFDIQTIVQSNDFINGPGGLPFNGSYFLRKPKYLCFESYITLEAQYIAGGPGAATYTFTGPNNQDSPLLNIPVDPNTELIIQTGSSNIANFEKPYNANQENLSQPPAHVTYHAGIDITGVDQFAGAWLAYNRANFDPNYLIIPDIDAYEVFDTVDLRPSFTDSVINGIDPIQIVYDCISHPDEVTVMINNLNYNNTRIIQYQLQINGVPSAWLDSPIFNNVIIGTHVALIKDVETGCINQITFVVAPCP